MIEDKAYCCVQKKINEQDKFIYMNCYESDVFKPNAEKMQWLRWLRDGSTWLTWRWYLLRWININWISVYSRIEEADPTKISKAEYIMEAIDEVYENINDARLVCIIDRWWDWMELIDEFLTRRRGFISRWKTNRKEKSVWKDTLSKIDELQRWKYESEKK